MSRADEDFGKGRVCRSGFCSRVGPVGSLRLAVSPLLACCAWPLLACCVWLLVVRRQPAWATW
jgi:hypothetical protein